MWGNVRGGMAHFQERRGTPAKHPVRQFFHGLSLPFHLLRALWGDPVARRRYLRVGLVQCLVILALAFAFKSWEDKGVGVAEQHGARVETTKGKHGRIQFRWKADGNDEDDEPADEPDGDEATVAAPPAPAQGLVVRELAFWAALFAAAHMAQWVVIALSRDFHDTISRDASLLTGLEPEDEDVAPRIRLDLKWVRRKISRRFRAFMVFTVGVPVLYCLSIPLPYRHALASVLISAWSAYWVVVFTTAQSGHAWRNSEAGPPWFLRGWSWLTTRVPGFRWGVPRAYGRFWENQTRPLFPPATEMEKQPWAFAGLALTGMLSMIPLVKCFLRPLMPVASAHLLVARHTAERAAASASEASASPAANSSANAA